MEVEEEASDEGRAPNPLKGPGLLMKEEVGHQSTTHIPFRSLCRDWPLSEEWEHTGDGTQTG